VHRWLGACGADEEFDAPVVAMRNGPTSELGCGPGRLVARLIRRGIPALDVDQSTTAIRLAGRCGAPALLGDLFQPLTGMGCWQKALPIDGNVCSTAGLLGTVGDCYERRGDTLAARSVDFMTLVAV